MGIKAETGPDNGEMRVGNAFSAMNEGPAQLFASRRDEAAPTARIRRPIPIYAVDIERLERDGAAALGTARRKGWRYLVEHDGALDVIDLPEDRKGQAELLVGGAVADNLVRSARKAQRIAEGEIDYEARLLDLNLIGDSILWLHAPDRPEADRFVSLSKTPRELNAAALIRRLRAAAVRKLSALDTAGDEAGG